MKDEKLSVHALLTPILKWGGKGAGYFMSAKKCAEFLNAMNLGDVKESEMRDFLINRKFFTVNGHTYFVGFHNEKYLAAANAFMRGEPFEPVAPPGVKHNQTAPPSSHDPVIARQGEEYQRVLIDRADQNVYMQDVMMFLKDRSRLTERGQNHLQAYIDEPVNIKLTHPRSIDPATGLLLSISGPRKDYYKMREELRVRANEIINSQ